MNQGLKRSGCLLALIASTALLSGCFVTEVPFDLPPQAEMKFIPDKVCINDQISFRYQFPNTEGLVNRCPSSTPGGCSVFYPLFELTPSSIFPTPLNATANYDGVIAGMRVSSEAPVRLTGSVSSSSPSYFFQINPRGEGVPRVRVAFTNPSTGMFQTAVFDVQNRVDQTIDPIDPGETRPSNVLFTPQCQGASVSWSAVDLAQGGETRSSSVQVSRLCNRENSRMLSFLLVFAATSRQTEAVAPGQCVDIDERSMDGALVSVSGIPAGGDIVAPGPPPCAASMPGMLPAPARAEIQYACR